MAVKSAAIPTVDQNIASTNKSFFKKWKKYHYQDHPKPVYGDTSPIDHPISAHGPFTWAVLCYLQHCTHAENTNVSMRADPIQPQGLRILVSARLKFTLTA